MKKYLLLIGFFLLLFGGAKTQNLIQGTLKSGAAAGSIEVWLKPNFTNSTQYLFQIGMPIAFPASASPAPTALNVTLDPGFVTTFGSNYTVTVNPVATATGGAEKYFNIVLVRAGAGASVAQNWTAGTEFKVLTATFSPSGAPASPVKLADYQDGGSDGQGNFYTQDGNNNYYVTSNSVGNFYASSGESTVGGTTSAGYAQTIASVPTGCIAPVAATVSNITTTTADISWGAVSGVTGYEYAVTTSGTPPSSGTTTTGTTYNATSLTAATQYYIHVRSACSGGSFSSWVTASFATANPSCTAPTLPAISSITSSSADINWNTVSGAVGYEYAVTTSATPPSSGTATTGTTYTATGLSSSTTYYAHVRSNCGPGLFSSWVSVPFTTLCSAPTSWDITNISSTSATIDWLGVSGVAGYEYAVTTSATPPSSGTATISTTYDATGLTPGTTYYVYVRSICSVGIFSSWASTSFATLSPPCIAPSTPIVTNVSNGVNISWGAVSGVTDYQYAITTSNTLPTSGTSIADTTYQATDLSSNTQYYVYVRSNCGVGGFSAWVSKAFKTGCLAPPVVTGGVTGNTADISWNSVNGAISYEYALTRYIAPPFSGVIVTDTSQHLVDLIAGMGYYFHVRTNCVAGGISEWTTYHFHVPGLEAYPNPVSNSLTINLYGVNGSNGQLCLYDAAGKLVKKITLTSNTVTVDTRGFAAGIYLIKYIDGNQKYTVKVLKQ